MVMVKDNYAAWSIKESDFPKKSSLEEQIKFILRYGILAPSTHNTQPWKFRIGDNFVDILPDWRYQLPQADPISRNLFISLGCCVNNILVAASYFGFKTKTKILTTSLKDTFIKVSFYREGTIDRKLARLFPFITQRYSNKLAYIKKPLKRSDLEKISDFHNQKGINPLFITDEKRILSFAETYDKAVSDFAKNSLFGKELSSWMRHSGTFLGDGMPGFTAGINPIQAFIGKFLIRYIPKFAESAAKKYTFLIKTSPVIGVIYTSSNNIVSWINAGRVYEEISLVGTSLKISSTILAAIVEHGKYSQQLANLISIGRDVPQLCFRLGYSQNNPYHTPRRRLEQSLI